VALSLLAWRAEAVELRVQYAAIERMLGEQVFTQEGRRYVRGSKTAKCNFAYLEHPRVEGDAGRLRMHARFTGRAAMNLFGQCVGLGDAFDFTMVATPYYRDGNIALRDVVVTSDNKTGYYIRRVCAAMSASLARDFRYSIAGETQKSLEDPGNRPQYKRELRNFSVSEVRVAKDAVVVVLDFQLTIK
jgi:hypothetical protein